ncbi:hypothetical protein TeGR_g5538, partial [Tetraparma gracilis]
MSRSHFSSLFLLLSALLPLVPGAHVAPAQSRRLAACVATDTPWSTDIPEDPSTSPYYCIADQGVVTAFEEVGGCVCECLAGYGGPLAGCNLALPCVLGTGNTNQINCLNDGTASGTTGDCACDCTGTGYEDTTCATASACVATETSDDNGTDGNFYCINGGSATGVTGSCGCTCAGES